MRMPSRKLMALYFSSVCQWKFKNDAGSFANMALDAAFEARFRHPFAHVAKAVAIRPFAPQFKSAPIVGHNHTQPVSRESDIQPHRARTGVFDGIVQGFFHDK